MPQPSTPAPQDWNITFSQNAVKDHWLLERLRQEIVPRLEPHGRLRILDLGCGSGATTFRLAELLPQAEVFGLDISEANIAAGRKQLAARQCDRISFVCGDYRNIRFPPGHFDVIVADGVLHLIPEAARDVMAKIADDLAPCGQFVFSIPHHGLFNQALRLVRSTLQRLKCSTTDWLILMVAKILHRNKFDESFFSERIHYMYLTPTIWLTRCLRAELRDRHGLEPVLEQSYPHTSLGKFQLRFCAYTKPAPASDISMSRSARRAA